ncbi:MAG TPA: vWA domain-containing protein [Phycisphaerae bacterium]|nr:vWA domain-containing protein [Phycisphaerae bacterium]
MNGFLQWLLGIDAAGQGAIRSWHVSLVAEYGNYVKLAMLGALAALVYLTVRSYRREGRAPRRAKGLLAGIRILVIVLVFVLLLRPAVVVQLTETLYDTIVFVIDDSSSMRGNDRYSGADGEKRARALAELIDTKVAGLPDISRRDMVRKVLLREKGAMADLARRHDFLVMRFSPEDPREASYVQRLKAIAAMPKGDWTGSTDDKGRAALAAALKCLDGPGGGRTDLAAAVTGVLRQTVGQRIAAMVIISDGQVTVENAGPALAEARRQAESRDIPIITVGIGDTSRRYRNIAVVSVSAPSSRIRRGSRATFTAKLVHSLFDEEKVVVGLRRRAGDEKNWQDVAQSDAVTLEGGGSLSTTKPADQAGPEQALEGQQLVTINVEPDALGKELGNFEYQAYVKPLPGEAKTSDNAAETKVRICDDKVNILLIGTAGWEFQYLRDFFLRERRRDSEGKEEEVYRVSVWQQDADPELNRDASSGMKLVGHPRDLQQLIGSPSGKPFPGYDMVILCDPMAMEGFDDQFIKLLKKYVQDHGGGLCYIAGRKHTRANLLETKAFASLAELLPVELDREAAYTGEGLDSPRPQAYQIYLTADYGVGHPITKLGAEGQAASGIWNVLPGIYWSHPVYKVKPLAQVLAVNSSPYRRTATDQSEPVLVVQSSGAGRVLYIGFDSTWRWRYLEDAYYFRTFWRDAVKFLAPVKIRQVSISASKVRYDLGVPVAVEAEALDDKYEPVTTDTYKILVIETSGMARRSSQVVLKAYDPKTRPGLYAGTIEDLEEGKYEFAPMVPVPDERVETSHIEVAPFKAEEKRPEADITTLKHRTGLATSENGFVQIYEFDKLSDLIHAAPLTFAPEKTYMLLDSRLRAGAALALFVVLLAVEWFLRKRQNMA